MKDPIKFTGHLQVIKVHKDGYKEMIIDKHNTISDSLLDRVRNSLTVRSQDNGVDCIVWGSFAVKGGTDTTTGSFCDGTFAGTTSSGTGGNLIQSNYSDDPYQARFSGTFNFTTTKKMNYFAVGRGYTAAGAGINNLLTTQYAYDTSLWSGNNFVQYDNGEILIINWILQVD